MKRTDRATPVDRHVGARLRERRITHGLSMQQLADQLGVTYQQLHKYERGINHLAAGRLFEVARVLSVPISYFFEGAADSGDATRRPPGPRERLTLELARSFQGIADPRVQEAVSNLARSRAGAPLAERADTA
jgi:transcriptional regulator with XRE-family HTH domain